MMLRSLGDVFARIANVNIPDEVCEQMIEDAAQKAADEVRKYGRERRAIEVERIRSQRERDEYDRIERQNGAEQLKRANAGAEARQAELKAAEDSTGIPHRR